MIITQNGKNSLIEAAKIIANYISASERKFNDYKEKLEYVAKIIPPVFTQGTEFSRNK